MKFQIERMTCGGCARSVRKAIAAVDPKAEISVDLPNRTVEVESSVSEYLFALALASEGYPAVSL